MRAPGSSTLHRERQAPAARGGALSEQGSRRGVEGPEGRQTASAARRPHVLAEGRRPARAWHVPVLLGSLRTSRRGRGTVEVRPFFWGHFRSEKSPLSTRVDRAPAPSRKDREVGAQVGGAPDPPDPSAARPPGFGGTCPARPPYRLYLSSPLSPPWDLRECRLVCRRSVFNRAGYTRPLEHSTRQRGQHSSSARDDGQHTPQRGRRPRAAGGYAFEAMPHVGLLSC